jgi:LPS export ABC transporter protein LptC
MITPEPRTVATLLLLLGGALISTMLLLATNEEEQKTARPELSLAYYLDKAELSGTGPDGKLLYEVWTERASQSPSDSSIALDRVRMKYTAPGGATPWELQANSGKIPADTSIIALRGNVIAVSRNDRNNTIIRTQRLNIDPEMREATTNRKVVVEFNGRKVNATGMLANLETNRLELLSNVNGKFLP